MTSPERSHRPISTNPTYSIQISRDGEKNSISVDGDQDGPKTFNDQEWQQIVMQPGAAQAQTRFVIGDKNYTLAQLERRRVFFVPTGTFLKDATQFPLQAQIQDPEGGYFRQDTIKMEFNNSGKKTQKVRVELAGTKIGALIEIPPGKHTLPVFENPGRLPLEWKSAVWQGAIHLVSLEGTQKGQAIHVGDLEIRKEALRPSGISPKPASKQDPTLLPFTQAFWEAYRAKETEINSAMESESKYGRHYGVGGKYPYWREKFLDCVGRRESYVLLGGDQPFNPDQLYYLSDKCGELRNLKSQLRELGNKVGQLTTKEDIQYYTDRVKAMRP